MSATGTERAELVEVARTFARRELLPRSLELDSGVADVVADCWRGLVELGYDRALLDEEHGGAGIGELDLLAALEELAGGDGGIALCVLLSNAALLALSGEQVEPGARWVLVPTSGLDGSGERVDIGVACALGAFGADGIVLAAEGQATIAIRAGDPGLELGRDSAQMGLRAAPAASITYSGPSRPTGSDGARPLMLLRAGTAAIARGIARRAYELALDYAQAREQGGRTIIEYDAVAEMLSAMAVRLTAPAALTLDKRHALAGKIAQTDAAVETTTDAVQVLGGIGYMHEAGMEKLMRDAKYCQLFPEPNWVAHAELMRLELAAPEGSRSVNGHCSS